MSEFALNASETRPARPAASRKKLTPLAVAGVGAVALAGFAIAASAVIGDLLAPPAKTAPTAMAAPVIDGGIASTWPDLKDGLPVVAASAAPPTTGALPNAARIEPAKIEPGKIEPAKVATLSNGPGPVVALSKSAPSAPARSEAKVAEVKAAQAKVVEAKTVEVKTADVVPADGKRPEARIPVPTPVAVASPPPPVKPVAPTRSAALVPPRDTVRAREEAAPPVAAARPRSEAAKPVAEAAKPKPDHKAEPVKTREAAAEKKAPARTATAGPAAEKPQKTAAAPKAAPAHFPEAAKTTVASAEPEETNILGVKLPSLAPAGRKIQESVSALGDAVRNAF